MNDVERLVKRLDLQPHPEGGFYRELYRSKGVISAAELGEGFSGPRNFSTSIYFLLTSNNFSAFHRIKQDELWYFHDGDALNVHVIDMQGNYTCHRVGKNLESGESPQLVVPAGSWFASDVSSEGAYSLVGCMVAPGFDFDDFEMANSNNLTGLYPAHREVIERYTRT